MSKANAAMSAKEGVEIWSMRDMWEDFGPPPLRAGPV